VTNPQVLGLCVFSPRQQTLNSAIYLGSLFFERHHERWLAEVPDSGHRFRWRSETWFCFIKQKRWHCDRDIVVPLFVYNLWGTLLLFVWQQIQSSQKDLWVMVLPELKMIRLFSGTCSSFAGFIECRPGKLMSVLRALQIEITQILGSACLVAKLPSFPHSWSKHSEFF